MAKGIKGITVEIGGNASPLGKALRSMEAEAKNAQKELKAVDKAAQLNPNNITLTLQKQKLLTDAIKQTKEKLEALKKAEKETVVTDKNSGQFRELQREIIKTEASLKSLKGQQKSVSVIGTAFEAVKEKVQGVLDKLAPVATGIANVGKAAGNLAVGGVKVVGSAVEAAGKGLAIYAGAVTAAGAAVTAFGIKGIKTASDLNEVENVVKTTFGAEGAKKIDQWSQAAAASFGISELNAKKFNGTMGAMLKSTGLSSNAVLDMSTSLTGLSGDMASFYNLDSEEAFDKLRAGIAGETEPLKQLGINMSAANLEAFALSQGITTAYKDMDQAAQTTLRYNFIMNATKDAQGDFAKTSDGLANQMRIMKLEAENLSASLGESLMPMASEITSSFMGIAQGAIPNIKNAFSALGDMLEMNPGSRQRFIFSIKETLAGVISSIKEMLPGITVQIGYMLPTLLEGFNLVLLGIAEVLMATLPIIVNTVLPALIQGFTDLISGLVPLIPVLLPIIVDAAMKIFMGLLDGLNLIVPQLMDMLPTLIDQVAAMLIANLPKIISAGIQLLISLINGIVQAIPNLITQVVALIPIITKAITDNLPALITAGIQLIVALAQGLPQAIPAIILALPEIINAIINGLFEQDWAQIGIDILKGIADGLVEGVKAIGKTIKSVASNLVDNFKNFLGIHSPSTVFADIVGKNMALGIEEGFLDTMDGVSKSMANAVPTSFEANMKTSGTGSYSGSNPAAVTAEAIAQALVGIGFSVDGRTFARLVREYANV